MTKGRDNAATIAERIARAKEARRLAQFALLKKTPQPDPKPAPKTEYFQGHYTGLTWRGQKIPIPTWRGKPTS